MTAASPDAAAAAAAAAAASAESYQWAYSIVDSSRVSTFFISILLIVYGSFRSLALEEDKRGEDSGGGGGAKEKDDKEALLQQESSGERSAKHGIQTLDSLQAMCLPLGASISLLVMFFFFDSMQVRNRTIAYTLSFIGTFLKLLLSNGWCCSSQDVNGSNNSNIPKCSGLPISINNHFIN